MKMTDKQIEKLVLGEIKRRGITWLDMVGNKCIGYGKDNRQMFRDSVFKATSRTDRMAELLCDGPFDLNADQLKLRIGFKDFMRFWWARCICQEDVVDRALEDAFVYFTNKMAPKK
jgi:hypothetical protein